MLTRRRPTAPPARSSSRYLQGARGLWAGLLATVVVLAASCGDPFADRKPGLEPGVAGSSGVPIGDDETCDPPRPGCACEVEGERVLCGKVESQIGEQKVCGLGYSVCTEGTYAPCIINNTITLAPAPPDAGDLGPGNHPASLGGLGPCVNNPCDPTCQHFADTPTGLSSGDAGILATDAGLTLPSNDASVPDPSCTGGTTQACSHSVCSAGLKLSAGCDDPKAPAAPFGCVSAVCTAMPSCCLTAWTGACAALVPGLCKVDCGNIGGTCVVCYKDAVDHDGDGYSFAQGDCADCDANVNPGAFDFAGNGIDEDCNGTADDEPTLCDNGLAMASASAADHAKAIDLCRTTTAAAVGPAKTWGVISSKLVQADGTQAPHALSYGILSKFGPSNLPQKGASMAVYSSGTARAQGDLGWVNPNGQVGSFNQGKSCAYPAGFPKNKSGCPNGSGTANDSTGLALSVRVPTNAHSFSYRFNFFSSEYPEWVCTAYNDGFVALLKTGYLPANPAANSGNISFDAANNPVSVNIGFFTITSGPKLTGTGMDGICDGKICGGSTDWLQTTAPVVPGETINLQFALWDTGDHVWDSFVLIDGFTWSVQSATIGTIKPPPPSPPTYADGYFIRDYDASKLCPLGSSPMWGLWSWAAQTPSDTSIAFTVQTADTAAGLPTAPADALQFSNPPGPEALVGQAAVARAGSPNTSAGSAAVSTTLLARGRPRNLPYLRVVSHLTPSVDKLSAPTLSAWDLQVDCQPDE
jgi:hypothetical protein